MVHDPSEIDKAIIETFKFLDQPNYSTVAKRLRSGPYKNLIEDLKSHYQIVDNTELNSDVSNTFVTPINWGTNALGRQGVSYSFDSDNQCQ